MPSGAALQVVVPFMSVASFKAHPTYLDLQNLRSGDSVLADQDEALLLILLEASAWAEAFCRTPLHAHLRTDFSRGSPDRYGRLKIHPDATPVRYVTAIGWAATPGNFTTMTNPACQIEDERQVITALAAANTSWAGSLQLGTPPPGCDLLLQMSYVAGYTVTVLAAGTVANATSITVPDPTGIFPGDILRVWEPGKDEAAVVASTYTPVNVFPPTQTAVPLAAGLVNAHTAGATVTGLPADVPLAVTHKAVDLLQRPGNNAASAWPGANVRSETRSPGSSDQASNMHEAKAMRILTSYRDVR